MGAKPRPSMSQAAQTSPVLRLRWHGRTTVGLKRSNNEDALLARRFAPVNFFEQTLPPRDGTFTGQGSTDRPGVLLAVADGMGGARAGEVASGMAVGILEQELDHGVAEGKVAQSADAELHRLLVQATERAHERIRDEGAANPSRTGMGTTLTAAWLVQGIALVAHVGDSRAYLFRAGHLKQITKDQSLVEKLLEDKIITPEEAERLAARNIILQALGGEEDIEVAPFSVEMQVGDTLLLCTDGLSGVVPDAVMEAELRRSGPLEDLVARLIAAAERAGGPDNITVLLGRVERNA